jgi:hypothetical protein
VDFPVQNITTDRQENADLEVYIRDFLVICGSKLVTCDCPDFISKRGCFAAISGVVLLNVFLKIIYYDKGGFKNMWGGKLANLLLAVWLILSGLVQLVNLAIPSGPTILALLAIVVGILIILEIRAAPTRNIGRLLLAIWLILAGLLPLLGISFPASATVLAVLAVAAGILMLLGR